MEQTTPTLIALSELKPGELGTFVESGTGKQLAGRLISMGFTPGVELQVTQNHSHGPLLISLRGAFVALGRGEAQKIMVQRREA